MATTENLDLFMPTRDDYISVVRDISQNMQKIDNGYGKHSNSLDAINESIAIIADGDLHIAINKGQYVYVKNNQHGLDEKLYVASANIVANGQITSSNVSEIPNGFLNNPQIVFETGTYTSDGYGTVIIPPKEGYKFLTANCHSQYIRDIVDEIGLPPDNFVAMHITNYEGTISPYTSVSITVFWVRL